MLKIIVDRSDNGNDFLCLGCSHGITRSGRGTEMEVYCTHDDMPSGNKLSFRVTQCDMYDPKLPWKESGGNYVAKVKAMQNQAMYLSFSKERPGEMVFITAAEFKKRRAAYEEQ